ncbi:hypothetical protein THAOC_36861, partial [Thalassiosira oceanica]
MLGRLFLSKSALLRWPTVAGRGARGGATAATVSPAYPWSTSLPPGGQWTEPDGTSLLGAHGWRRTGSMVPRLSAVARLLYEPDGASFLVTPRISE